MRAETRLTEHVGQDDGGWFYWHEGGETDHEPRNPATRASINAIIARELAQALLAERERSAKLRAALEHYANEDNWTGASQSYPDFGPQGVWQVYDTDGYEVAQQALREGEGNG